MAPFGGKIVQARKHYREFVANGISAGCRPDLVGGGIVRSAGGWGALKAIRKNQSRMKGDERILGGGDFVDRVLTAAQEDLDRKYKHWSEGYDLDWVSAAEISAKLYIASSTASESVARGRRIVEAQGLELLDGDLE